MQKHKHIFTHKRESSGRIYKIINISNISKYGGIGNRRKIINFSGRIIIIKMKDGSE